MFAFLNNIRYHNDENNYLGCLSAEIIPIEPALVNTSEGRFSDINLMINSMIFCHGVFFALIS